MMDQVQMFGAREDSNFSRFGLVAVFLCSVVTACFVIAVPECRHWYVIPITACGILVAPDGLAWLSRKGDALDLYGVLGLFSIVFFFVVPLLYVPLGPELSRVPNQPLDYRPWLGFAAALDFGGLLAFFVVRGLSDRRRSRTRKVWVVSPSRLYPVGICALLISLVAQVYFVFKVGGLEGVMSRETDLSGMGFYFLFSESFPSLLFCVVLLHFRVQGRLNTKAIFTLLIFCVFLAFLFAGLRGSRSNFLNSVIIMAVVLNYQGYKLPKKWVLASCVPLVIFLVVYALFKELRNDFSRVDSVGDYIELSEKTGRDWRGFLLGDIGRANIEALTIYRLSREGSYELAYGSTYVGATAVLIPGVIRPYTRNTKVASSDLLYGMGAYSSVGVARRESTRIFGLAGEAMLNFGYLGVPVVFGLAGFIVARIRVFFLGLPWWDMRVFLYPMLFRVVIALWHLDLVNMIFAIVKNGGFLFLVVCLVSERRTLPAREAARI